MFVAHVLLSSVHILCIHYIRQKKTKHQILWFELFPIYPHNCPTMTCMQSEFRSTCSVIVFWLFTWHILSYSGMLSDMFSGTYSDDLSDLYLHMFGDMYFHILSGMCLFLFFFQHFSWHIPEIVFVIFSDMLWDVFWHVMHSGIFCDIYSQLCLTFIRTFSLTYILKVAV